MNKHCVRKITYKKLFSPLVLSVYILLLSSCSGNYVFNSNLKAEGAEQYFSASKVDIFNDEKEFNAPYEFVGLVEGEDCQHKVHQAKPDLIIARTQARQAANKQNANAVIFTSCIDIESNFCVAQIVCYGKAYRLASPDKTVEKE